MDPVHIFWALSLGTGRFGRSIGVGWALPFHATFRQAESANPTDSAKAKSVGA